MADEVTIIKIPSLTLKQKSEVGQYADLVVELPTGTFRTKSSTFLIDLIASLVSIDDDSALAASQGTIIKALIDWGNEIDGFIFDYAANWTLTPAALDVGVVIPACTLRETDNTVAVAISGTSGTVVENGGIVLTKVSALVYTYSFVNDLTTITDGTDNVYIIVKNLAGTLYTRNVSLNKALSSEDEAKAKANTYTISPSGADYTTIQAALTANTTGGELFLVYPGTYTDDTIAFTAINQCVIGVGTTSQQIVTTADDNIVDFGAFTGCRMSDVKIEVTAATSAIDTVTGSTGDLALRDCHISMTNSSVATLVQPSCIAVTGAGTVTVKRGTIDYNNAVDDGDGATAFKSACLLGTGSIINLDFAKVDVDGGNQSLVSTVILGASTGVANVTDCKIDLLDAGATIALAFYDSGSGEHEIYRNTIHVEVGTGTAYGILLTGTVQYRSIYNHIHCKDTGGASYSFNIGSGTKMISQFDDIIPNNGVIDNGTFYQMSSQEDGKLGLSAETEPSITIHNITEEDIEGGREGHLIFKGEQSGGELTTLARIVAQHDGTSDDEKGDLIFQTNDGSDSDAPTERVRIDSAGKVSVSSETASEMTHFNASKQLESLPVATYPSLTEFSYGKGVTSAIQTQINAKAPSASPTFTTKTTHSYLTASELVSSNASKELVSLPVATYPSLTQLALMKKSVTSEASSATPSPVGSQYENEYTATALAAAATFAAPSGTPVDNNNLMVRIKDDGTARTLAWNAIYYAFSKALPITTILGKTIYINFIYDSAASKWNLVSVVNEL